MTAVVFTLVGLLAHGASGLRSISPPRNNQRHARHLRDTRNPNIGAARGGNDDAPARASSRRLALGLIGAGSSCFITAPGAKAAASSDDGLDPLTRELLARTERNRQANAAAVVHRDGLQSVPFGGVGKTPSLDALRASAPAPAAAVTAPAAQDGGVAAAAASGSPTEFHSGAFGREEYNNAFAASDNTNISPKEAYDTILSRVRPDALATTRARALVGGVPSEPLRALDLGCGAGVSTEVRRSPKLRPFLPRAPQSSFACPPLKAAPVAAGIPRGGCGGLE